MSDSNIVKSIKKPSIYLHLTDLPRAFLERHRANQYVSSLSKTYSKKRSHVIVVPGLTATPWSWKPMRIFLSKLGYKAHDWTCGRNLGRISDIDKIIAQIDNIYESSGEKVILMGWSLGGIYIRRVAQICPDKIKSLYTFGAPYRHIKAPNYATWFFNLMQRLRGGLDEPEWVDQLKDPISGIDSYAFYSKKDGIVAWQACMDEQDPTHHQNILVNSSHFGMGANAEVFEKMIDILK